MNHRKRLFIESFRYSVPVLLGYLAIGIAFGLFLVDAGYPWWLALVMSIVMYAGAGQYIAVGLFVSGVGLFEAALVQLVVNARHIAYGLSLFNRLKQCGRFKYYIYIIFALTDETFALLSSLPDEKAIEERGLCMFYVAILDQIYWITGSVIGAIIGSLLPFSIEGISFALTALFIILMIEQIIKIKKPFIFIISAIAAVATVILFPNRLSLFSALIIALIAVQLFQSPSEKYQSNKEGL
jgi:4-azaleucine resistance transporter AzlC